LLFFVFCSASDSRRSASMNFSSPSLYFLAAKVDVYLRCRISRRAALSLVDRFGTGYSSSAQIPTGSRQYVFLCVV
jgi:hypothetical protein